MAVDTRKWGLLSWLIFIVCIFVFLAFISTASAFITGAFSSVYKMSLAGAEIKIFGVSVYGILGVGSLIIFTFFAIIGYIVQRNDS